MKKEYYSPEFEYNKIYLNDVICASAETPMIDIIEDDDSGDV